MKEKTATGSDCTCVTADSLRMPISPAARFDEKLAQLPPEEAKLFEELARYESEHINHNFSDTFDYLQMLP